jgi:hypothetical protein
MAYDELKRIAGTHTGAAPPHHKPFVHPNMLPVQHVPHAGPVQRATLPAHLKQKQANAARPPAKISSSLVQRPPGSGPVARAPGSSAHVLRPGSAPVTPAVTGSLGALAVAAGIQAPSAPASPASPAPATSTVDTSSSSQTAPATPASSMAPSDGGRLIRSVPSSAPSPAPSSGPFSRVVRDASQTPGMPPPAGANTRGGTKASQTMGYRGTGEITYCPINSAGVVNAGATVVLPNIRPQKPFQGQKLIVDPTTAALFTIVDLKIGNEPVAVAAGAVSAQNFPPANGPTFEWKVCDGVDFIFTVLNNGTVSTAFTAMVVGEIVVAA